LMTSVAGYPSVVGFVSMASSDGGGGGGGTSVALLATEAPLVLPATLTA